MLNNNRGHTAINETDGKIYIYIYIYIYKFNNKLIVFI